MHLFHPETRRLMMFWERFPEIYFLYFMGCTRSQVNDNKKDDMKIQRNLIIKSNDDSYLDIIQNNNFKIIIFNHES